MSTKSPLATLDPLDAVRSSYEETAHPCLHNCVCVCVRVLWQEVGSYKKISVISQDEFDTRAPKPPVDPNQEVPQIPRSGDLSICLSVYTSIYLHIYLSLYTSIYLSTHLSIALHIYLSLYTSSYLSTLELHDTHGTHGTPRCQIITVPTILEFLHDGTTVDYYTTGAGFRYVAAASTLLLASHCVLLKSTGPVRGTLSERRVFGPSTPRRQHSPGAFTKQRVLRASHLMSDSVYLLI